MSRMETNHRRHRGLLMTAFSPSTEKSAPLLYLGSCLRLAKSRNKKLRDIAQQRTEIHLHIFSI